MFSLNFISNLIKNAGGAVSDVYKESEKKKQEFKKEHKTISSISDFIGGNLNPAQIAKTSVQAPFRGGMYIDKSVNSDTTPFVPGETGGLFGRLEKSLYGNEPVGSVQQSYTKGGGGVAGAGMAGLGLVGAGLDLTPIAGGGKTKVGKEVIDQVVPFITKTKSAEQIGDILKHTFKVRDKNIAKTLADTTNESEVKNILTKLSSGDTSNIVKSSQPSVGAKELSFANRARSYTLQDKRTSLLANDFTPSETSVFHGTDPENIDSILREGSISPKISKFDNAKESTISLSRNHNVSATQGGDIVFEIPKEKVSVRNAPGGVVKGDEMPGFEIRSDNSIPLKNIKKVYVVMGNSEKPTDIAYQKVIRTDRFGNTKVVPGETYQQIADKLKTNGIDVSIVNEGKLSQPSVGAKIEDISTDPIKSLESSLKSREPLIKGQQEAVSVEKAIRSRRAEETLASENLYGVKGMNTYMKQLGGELPKQPEFQPIVEQVGKENIDKLVEGIRTSKNLQPYQKATTYEAFDKLLNGKALQQSEYDALGEHFGYKIIDQINDNKPELSKMVKILNTPQTAMASSDMSGIRQAVVALSRHPQNFPKFIRDNFKYWGLGKGEQNYKAEMDKLYDLKNYNVMRKHGVDFSGQGRVVEESYYGSYAEDIPILGKVVKASERAYSGALTNLRAHLGNSLFEQQLSIFKENPGKFTLEQQNKMLDAIAETVNNSTGRGSLGKPLVGVANKMRGSQMTASQKKAIANSIDQIASVGLFSPKLIGSRLNFINPLYYFERGIGEVARKERMTSFATMVGATLSMVAMIKMAKSQGVDTDIEVDPRSSNFLKIKSGERTYIDLTGGHQAYARVLAQALSGESKNIKTGKVKPLGVEYGSRDVGDVLTSFARQKASPLAATAMNTLIGKDTIGKPTNLLNELKTINAPLYLKDAVQAFEAEGLSPSLASTLLAGFFGGGTTTMDTPQQEREAKRESRKINRAKSRKNWGFTDTFLNRLTGTDIDLTGKLK